MVNYVSCKPHGKNHNENTCRRYTNENKKEVKACHYKKKSMCLSGMFYSFIHVPLEHFLFREWGMVQGKRKKLTGMKNPCQQILEVAEQSVHTLDI